MSRNLVVSVQDRNAVDWQMGHIATGLLLEPTCVLVPDAPDRLFELAAHLDVLIFEEDPDPQADQPPAEVIRPGAVTRFIPDHDGQKTFAMIQLGVPSAHEVSLPEETLDEVAPELREALTTGGDVWAILAGRQDVPSSLSPGPSKELWDHLAERLQNERPAALRFKSIFCKLFPRSPLCRRRRMNY